MIFRWFKREHQPDATERLTNAIPWVLSAYGAFMERYPLAILDTAKLPLSKADI
jgi:hypothetical protein